MQGTTLCFNFWCPGKNGQTKRTHARKTNYSKPQERVLVSDGDSLDLNANSECKIIMLQARVSPYCLNVVAAKKCQCGKWTYTSPKSTMEQFKGSKDKEASANFKRLRSDNYRKQSQNLLEVRAKCRLFEKGTESDDGCHFSGAEEEVPLAGIETDSNPPQYPKSFKEQPARSLWTVQENGEGQRLMPLLLQKVFFSLIDHSRKCDSWPWFGRLQSHCSKQISSPP